MTNEQLQHYLESIKDMDERSDVREFLRMTPEHQRTHNYRQNRKLTAEMEKLRRHIDQRFDELVEMQQPLWRKAITPLAAAGAMIMWYIDPNLPRPH